MKKENRYPLFCFETEQSDYAHYNGMGIEKIVELDRTQYDKQDIGIMFELTLFNGAVVNAFLDELKIIEVEDE